MTKAYLNFGFAIEQPHDNEKGSQTVWTLLYINMKISENGHKNQLVQWLTTPLRIKGEAQKSEVAFLVHTTMSHN